MRRECRERFPCHVSRHVRDKLAVSFEVGGGENVPGIPGVCTTRTFAYLVGYTIGYETGLMFLII